jgi:hypothetical protein
MNGQKHALTHDESALQIPQQPRILQRGGKPLPGHSKVTANSNFFLCNG